MHLADIYRTQEHYDWALDAYAEALGYDESLTEALFATAVIQLTKIEDPDRGLTALTEALEVGFDDQEAISRLLSDPNLLERNMVESLLQQRGLLPEEVEGED